MAVRRCRPRLRAWRFPAVLALALALAAGAACAEADDTTPPAAPETAADAPAAAEPGTGATPAAESPTRASLWGLQDPGGTLVVIDGIPWGGAFTPLVSRVNLAGLERAQVQGGTAPVLYGTASFGGIVRAEHYAPDETPGVAHASGGSYGSASAGASAALPALGAWHQSLAVDATRDRLRGPDQGVTDGHALYRGAGPLAGGRLHVDAELETETRLPESPVLRVGTALAATPLDANYQPEGARVGAHRVQFSVGYDHDSALGPVSGLVAYGVAGAADRRGFLRSPPEDAPPEVNADAWDQDRRVRTVYADLHVRTAFTDALALGYGADWLGGRATQASTVYGYYVPLDASVRPSLASALVGGTSTFDDRRSYAGAYAELDWNPATRYAASLAARLSRNEESLAATASAGFVAPDAQASAGRGAAWRGNVGASAEARLGDPKDTATPVVRLTGRLSSQPAPSDFGPEYQSRRLSPTTGRRLEGEFRGGGPERRLEWDLTLAYTEVGDLVVAQTDPTGNPVLANAGIARVRTADLDLRWHPAPGRPLTVSAGVGAHRDTFGTTRSLEDGVPADFVGRDLNLAPRRVASAAVAYDPPTGLHASATMSYGGAHYLDRLNQARAGGYAQLDARAGWRTARGGITLKASNLTNRRDAVAESEFGDAAFYRLPARAVALEVYVTWH